MKERMIFGLIILLLSGAVGAESLWREEGMLFVDPKARAIGDIVTIIVAESTTASHRTTTEREKGIEISGGATPAEENLLDFIKFFGASGTSSYRGEGTTIRTGDIIGKISARVVKVLPNGNLAIKGEKKIRVNNEEEVMILTGVIRPEDIRADNTILSYYVSDANIRYRGGINISDKEKPGIFTRILCLFANIFF
jgi:flagellar L-ring protein precursor FlgH